MATSPRCSPSAEQPAAPHKVHFRGLNSLRFLAAFFVVLDHVPLNQESVGLPHPNSGTFFYRGSFAVCFFFALSGFLITYLLLDELRAGGTIRVGSFYLRRVCRIWPLYFAVVGFGLFFYSGLLPHLGIRYRVDYSLPLALALYGALLPNLMNSLYTVGGILNPSWSIGVEEQFYLLWAPVVQRWHRRLPAICCGVFAVSLASFCLVHYDLLGTHWSKRFFEQLKFHYMAAGGLCAWWLHRRPAALMRLPVFANRAAQLLMAALLLDLYLTSFVPWNWLGYEAAQVVLYCWLILEVAANPRSLAAPLANRGLDHLGTISYGIYMLHMPAVYAASQLFKHTTWWRGRPLALYCAGYYGVVFGLTFLLAFLSYRYFERPFLRLKDRRFTVVPTQPADAGAGTGAGDDSTPIPPAAPPPAIPAARTG